MVQKKYVYAFGDENTEGKAEMIKLLGGKGANLGEMASLGIQVPPGFTISTEACVYYFKNKNTFPSKLWDEILARLKNLEKGLEKNFGDPDNPLLVSVRSGARVSMPGMMDTVLNLGLTDITVQGLAKSTKNEWFALDSYRRFISMFGNVVLGVSGERFEAILTKKKLKRNIEFDTEFTIQELKSLIRQFKALVVRVTGEEFLEDPMQQLRMAVEAVFNSWNTERAGTYRRLNGIPHEWGTAVTIQSMVFGNMGETSGTGVAFTRNPATGEKKFYGEYMLNAQGEDVVAGIRTPNSIEMLEQDMPEVYQDLVKVYQKLENHYKDMQDLEFTIENQKLFLLQTRAGKRTAASAIKVAIDMVNEGLISKREALMRVPANQLDQIFHPMISPKAKLKLLGKGLGASPGAAAGKIVFTAERAQEMADKKEKVILVRMETSPEDIQGMSVSQGILTAKGGMTSHAAVVARAMGKPCVSGVSTLDVNVKRKKCRLGGVELKEMDSISLDGTTGQVFNGAVPLIQSRLTSNFTRMMTWAGEVRALQIRANADTPHDALMARDFGAQGIGLCRTEHMFFDEERIFLVRKMIVAEDEKAREEVLKKLLPIQRADFAEIFKVMDGLPVTVRLLDPPLHEFLPNSPAEVKNLAKEMKVSPMALAKKIETLKEVNPMLGHRGCRLGITFPDIYRMQVRAIIEAACRQAKKGIKVFPEIMVPLVAHVNEFKIVREIIVEEAEDVIEKAGVDLSYKIGTMIELPRAAMTADELAVEADFFSFGTNDLTQTAFGLSRDDSGSFLNQYLDKGLLTRDPFVSVDQEGVGQLIRIAVEKGKMVKPNIHLGVCGEHGGDPVSINFFNTLGLGYVSCSPYRVPTAILAAAQAVIQEDS
ncbi:MAG: pyruvate, phosphate dikinase [Nitrospinae bacterium]|nr:pyruvate, phosphate dikinase [Nitrospinota bacterium]MBL7019560.1 pyruvate, phosphate dikinase [Nitrospinaceae bacterium]